MYRLFADGNVFYSPDIFDQAYLIRSATLDLSINAAGTLTIEVPPHNIMWGSFIPLSTVITVEENDTEIWRGRVLSLESGFNNMTIVTCEGVLGYLLDSIVRPYQAGSNVSLSSRMQWYIDQHNNQVGQEAQFQVGVNDLEGTYSYDENSKYPTTLDDISNIVDSDEHEFYIRAYYQNGHNIIDFTKESGGTATQSIAFGVNLLDLTNEINGEEIYTILIPIGKDGLTISSVNGGNDYLETEAAEAHRISKTKEWQDISNASQLLSLAKDYLLEDIKTQTLTLSAIDLHILYGDTYQSWCIGDHIPVETEPHGISAELICNSISLDLIEPMNSTYTLGLEAEPLSSQQNRTAQMADEALAGLKEIDLTLATYAQIDAMFL